MTLRDRVSRLEQRPGATGPVELHVIVGEVGKEARCECDTCRGLTDTEYKARLAGATVLGVNLATHMRDEEEL